MRSAPLSIVLALLLAFAGTGARAADDHGDSAANATGLAPGASQAGRFDRPGDQDWFAFAAVAGGIYDLSTRAGLSVDTTLTLVDRDGRSAIAFDDDSGYALSSRIVWRAPASATYFLVVEHYSPFVGAGAYRVRAAGPPPPATSGSGNAGGGGGSGVASLEVPRIFDPKLADLSSGAGARLPIEAVVGSPGESWTVDLSLTDGSGALVRTLASGAPVAGGAPFRVEWDGRTAGGLAVADPGTYEVRLDARPSGGGAPIALARRVDIVRLGATALALEPVPGTGAEHDYLYHKAGGTPGSYFAIRASDPDWQGGREHPADLADLDLDDGRPRPAPPLWRAVDRPPGGRRFSLPAVLDAGARLRVRALLGESAVSQASGLALGAGYPVAGAPLRVRIGGQVASPAPVAPGDVVEADLAGAVATGVDRRDLDLAIEFEYEDGGLWHPVPGGQVATVRVYGVLGRANLEPGGGAGSGAPYLPWVAALDLVSGWVAGRASDEAGVARIVADGIFEREGLYYDRSAGAPSYANGPLDDLELDLGGYFDRSMGGVVNCSDCATLVATLANMVGCDLDYGIMGWNFVLHDVRLVGYPFFTSDVFNTGTRSAFSFHAAATRDGGLTVHDACLSVDDDAFPSAAPHLEARPRGMQFDRYRRQLTPGTFSLTGPPRRARLR